MAGGEPPAILSSIANGAVVRETPQRPARRAHLCHADPTHAVPIGLHIEGVRDDQGVGLEDPVLGV